MVDLSTKPDESDLERIDLSELTQEVDPNEAVLTESYETPDERKRRAAHQMSMEADEAKHRRRMQTVEIIDKVINRLVVETGPTIVAGVIVIAICLVHLATIYPGSNATDNQRDAAASQLGLILTGTVAFIFGRSVDPRKD